MEQAGTQKRGDQLEIAPTMKQNIGTLVTDLKY